MSLLFGALPKVIWLRVGNCRTEEIVGQLQTTILGFAGDAEGALLVIGASIAGRPGSEAGKRGRR